MKFYRENENKMLLVKQKDLENKLTISKVNTVSQTTKIESLNNSNKTLSK